MARARRTCANFFDRSHYDVASPHQPAWIQGIFICQVIAPMIAYFEGNSQVKHTVPMYRWTWRCQLCTGRDAGFGALPMMKRWWNDSVNTRHQSCRAVTAALKVLPISCTRQLSVCVTTDWHASNNRLGLYSYCVGSLYWPASTVLAMEECRSID